MILGSRFSIFTRDGRRRRKPVERILPIDERDQRLLDLHRRERAARGIEERG